MNPLDDPRVQPDVYFVFPTDYDTLAHSDKMHWCFRVVNGHEWGWSVRNGWGDIYAMNRKGKWIMESRGSGSNRFRRYTLEEALALALKHIDSYTVMGRTAKQASDEIAARIAAGQA